MKKFFIYILLPVLLFMLTGTAFTSCSGGDDESTPTLYPTGENPIQQQYFSIEGASFIAGEMPKSTIQETIQGIVLGNNNITISSGEPYATFYLGIEGVSGYYEIQANDVATTRAAIYTYAIILNVNGTIENFAITLKGKTQSGEITEACSIAVDKMEPSVDNSTLTIEEQKEYLEKVGIDFINELKSNNFEETHALITQIINKYTSNSYNNTELDEWANNSLNNVMQWLVDSKKETYYDYYGYYYYTTNYYTTIYAASNFRGNFTAQNNSWVYEDANHLQFNVKDNSGANCVLKITTSGNEKKVYVGTYCDSKLEYLGKDSYNYYKYKETTNYDYRYLMVPEVINITLTRNDAIVISVKLTTDLSSMKGEDFNINTDKYDANLALTIGQHTISVNKAKYTPNANSEIKFQIQKGYKSLLSIGLSTDTRVANNELQDATNTNISINILGKIQIKGTCANISQYLSCLENADNNDWNSTQFKAYIAEANNLLEFGLYNNNQRFAKAKLLCFGGDQWYYTPAIIFEDGTSYSFEQFFNEESFREIIEVVEAMMREYEVMLAN